MQDPNEGLESKKDLYFKRKAVVMEPSDKLNIDPQVVYQTRSGEKVRIYTTDVGPKKVIHGALYRNNEWVLETWQADGRYRADVDRHKNDIISPWGSGKSIELKVDHQYKTQDGRKVKIVAVNPKSVDTPVVGLVYDEGEWKPRIWNAQGICKVPYTYKNDIVSEWSET